MSKKSLQLATLTLALVALAAAPARAGREQGKGNATGRIAAPGVTVSAAARARTKGKAEPALAAPVLTSCGSTDGTTSVAWDAVEGATKYSVEYVVGYDLTGDDGCADAYLEFDYGTTGTTLDTPIADFDHDFCTEEAPCVASAVSVTVRVKGLNPPSGGPRGSGSPQNNPFSELCTILADPCAAAAAHRP